ncbi:MAG TPA: hypothetical protein VK689_03170 [Armatimonadota bacterium]|nr:hypothetical protein [Armatimonadota bacterium]
MARNRRDNDRGGGGGGGTASRAPANHPVQQLRQRNEQQAQQQRSNNRDNERSNRDNQRNPNNRSTQNNRGGGGGGRASFPGAVADPALAYDRSIYGDLGELPPGIGGGYEDGLLRDRAGNAWTPAEPGSTAWDQFHGYHPYGTTGDAYLDGYIRDYGHPPPLDHDLNVASSWNALNGFDPLAGADWSDPRFTQESATPGMTQGDFLDGTTIFDRWPQLRQTPEGWGQGVTNSPWASFASRLPQSTVEASPVAPPPGRGRRRTVGGGRRR